MTGENIGSFLLGVGVGIAIASYVVLIRRINRSVAGDTSKHGSTGAGYSTSLFPNRLDARIDALDDRLSKHIDRELHVTMEGFRRTG